MRFSGVFPCKNMLDLRKVQLMAILNVTDDSFFSGSRCPDDAAIEARCRVCISEGADIIDIGGYSSRPGADDISVEEEWKRVEKGISILRSIDKDIPVSVDTFRSEIVRRVVEKFGEVIVNDISAGTLDNQMLKVVAENNLTYIAMHMRGTPQDMHHYCEYDDDVAKEVVSDLKDRVEVILEAGVSRDRIVLDPGFGFSKNVDDNHELMWSLYELNTLRFPFLVGVSRKSMLYKPLNLSPQDVLPASLALGWEAMRQGARILRVHDVAPTRQIIDMFNQYYRD